MSIPQQIIPATGIAPGLNIASADMTGPVSYTTGGVFVSSSVLGLGTVKWVSAMDLSTDGANFVRIISVSGQGANKFKVLWFSNSLGTEVPNATNLSTKAVRIVGLGV